MVNILPEFMTVFEISRWSDDQRQQNRSMAWLAKIPKPDVRLAFLRSVSAVESFVQFITKEMTSIFPL